MTLTISTDKIAEYRKGIINAVTVLAAVALYRYGPTNQVYTFATLILGFLGVVATPNKPKAPAFGPNGEPVH